MSARAGKCKAFAVTPGTDQLLARARRDVAGSDPGAAVASLRTCDPTVEVLVELAYAEVINTRFSAGVRTAQQAADLSPTPAAMAVLSLALAFLGPTRRNSPEGIESAFRAAISTADCDPWVRYLLSESAMSNGAITEAVALTETDGSVKDPVTRALLLQARCRALAFGGRLIEADETALALTTLAVDQRLVGLEAVAHSLRAYLAAQQSDRARLRRESRAALALATHPTRHYLYAGAHTLVAYALAADGQLALGAATLLSGAGSDLRRLQFVDRAYGYEVLASAALQNEDLTAAGHWLQMSLALRATGMAAAAVGRTEAMVRSALGEHPLGAAAAERAETSAAGRGGRLDAARAQVLHGRALSHLGTRQRAIGELEAVTEAATELGALRIRALAVREMRALGRRVPPPGRDGQALSPREKQVALLVTDGLSNRQVARLLHVSERTVASHLATILRRLGLTSRAGLPAALGLPSSGWEGELTPRQAEVAGLVARGLSNNRISTELGVSVKTVEKHVGDALARTGLPSRTALAAAWQGRS